jgi:hypothetical protein
MAPGLGKAILRNMSPTNASQTSKDNTRSVPSNKKKAVVGSALSPLANSSQPLSREGVADPDGQKVIEPPRNAQQGVHEYGDVILGTPCENIMVSKEKAATFDPGANEVYRSHSKLHSHRRTSTPNPRSVSHADILLHPILLCRLME